MTNLEFYKDEMKLLGIYKVYCLVNHLDICKPFKDSAVVDWLCEDCEREEYEEDKED